MKRVFLVFLVCLLPTLAFSHPNFAKQKVGNWYESETLHKKQQKIGTLEGTGTDWRHRLIL